MIGVGELVIVFVVIVFGALVLSAFLWATFGKAVFLRVAAVVGALAVAFLFLSMLLVPALQCPTTPTQASVSQSISHTHEVHPPEEIHLPSVPPQPEIQEMDFLPGSPVPGQYSEAGEWDENFEETCETDVYTHGRFAVASLARKIAARVREKAPAKAVVVVTDETRGSHSHRLLNYHSRTLDRITSELQNDGYTIVAYKPKQTKDDSPIITVELNLDQITGQFSALAQRPPSHSPIDTPKSGKCIAKVSIDGIVWNCSTLFVDKLWISDFGAFQTAQQGQTIYAGAYRVGLAYECNRGRRQP